MKSICSLLIACFFSTAFHAVVIGQNLTLKQTNESGVYKKGERIKVTLFSKKPCSDSIDIQILKNFEFHSLHKKVKCTADSLVIFEEESCKPSSMIFEASSKNESASIGLIVDPEKFEPVTKHPADFESFWEKEKSTLRAVAIKTQIKAVPGTEAGFQCFDVEINCTGPQPARGYFARPASAKEKTLPIVVYFHAAGVNASWCRSEPDNAIRFARMGNGALSFDLNAHGMKNGQPDEYYNQLNEGDLKNYSNYRLDNLNDIYFRGMYLRIIRTLDFLTSQPEWDGKRILVIGESQGGGQALAAAGLDHRVTAVVATVPAMCDWGGFIIGRKDSWPYPYSSPCNKDQMLNTLPYFDVAHLLKGSKATLVTEIGLIDQSCLSTAVYAAINQAAGPKITFNVPYRAHHLTQEAYRELWLKSVSKKKDDFIQDYLK